MPTARYAVVFDVDGTLVDSRAAIPACLTQTFADLGLPVIEFDPQRVIGPPLRSVLPGLLDELRVHADVDEVLSHFRQRYIRDAAKLTTVFEGIREALDEISRDFALAVATSKPDILTVPLLDEIDLAKYFEVVAAPTAQANESKRVTLARCAQQLGALQIQPLVMVGDHHFDIEAAIAGHLSSIGVTWGMSTRADLQAAGPTRIVDHPLELAGAVAALTQALR
jgi:phosphoglycolate phosphatase